MVGTCAAATTACADWPASVLADARDDQRDLLCAVRPLPWSMTPKQFPPHQVAYRCFTRFRNDGTWEI
jgi:hypothetical protein